MDETSTELKLDLTVELGREFVPGQRRALIKLGGKTIFSETVYDNERNSAEDNIVLLFASRLQRLLEDE